MSGRQSIVQFVGIGQQLDTLSTLALAQCR
jgi:hypothetical protein